MSFLSTLVVKIASDFDSRGFDQAETKTGKVSEGFGKLGQVLGGLLAGGALLSLGQKLLEIGSDAEEMQGKFNVVFATTGSGVTAQLQEFASAANRSIYELQGMAATMGDVLKPLGFAEEDAAKFSVQLTKLATDLSSFNNMSMDEALRRLQGTLIGSHENALAFGVVINENTLKQELASMGAAEFTGTMLEQAKVQARINLLMQGTTDAQGDAIRTSGSYANQMRGLQAAFQELGVKIAQSGILEFVTSLVAKATGFIRGVTEMSSGILKVGTVTAGAAAGLAALALAFGPVGVAVGAVGVAVVLLIKHWDTIVEWIRKTFPQAWQVGKQVLNDIERTFNETVDFVTDVWAQFGDDIINSLVFAGRVIGDFIDTTIAVFDVLVRNFFDVIAFVKAIFTGDWRGAFEAASDIASRTFDFIRTFVLNAIDRLLQGVQAIVGFFDDDLAASIQGIRDRFTDMVPDNTRADLDGITASSGEMATQVPRHTETVGSAFDNLGQKADTAGKKSKDLKTATIDAATSAQLAWEISLRSMGIEFDGAIATMSELQEAERQLAIATGKHMKDMEEQTRASLRTIPQETGAALEASIEQVEASRFSVAMAAMGAAGNDALNQALSGMMNNATQALADFLSFGTDVFGSTGLGGVVGTFIDTVIGSLVSAFAEVAVKAVGDFVLQAGSDLLSLAAAGGPILGIAAAFFTVTTLMGADWGKFVQDTLYGIGQIDDALRDLGGSRQERGMNEIRETVRGRARDLQAQGMDPGQILDELIMLMTTMVQDLGVVFPAADIRAFIVSMLQQMGIFETPDPGPQNTSDITTLLYDAGFTSQIVNQIIDLINQAVAAGWDPSDLAQALAGFGINTALMSQIMNAFINMTSVPSAYFGAPMMSAGQLFQTHGMGSREFFVPSVDGSIVTADAIARRMGGGMGRAGDTHVHVHVGNEELRSFVVDNLRGWM